MPGFRCRRLKLERSLHRSQNMPEQTQETHTIAELVAESERIRARAATIMAEIESILQEMADRKRKESRAKQDRLSADE